MEKINFSLQDIATIVNEIDINPSETARSLLRILKTQYSCGKRLKFGLILMDSFGTKGNALYRWHEFSPQISNNIFTRSSIIHENIENVYEISVNMLYPKILANLILEKKITFNYLGLGDFYLATIQHRGGIKKQHPFLYHKLKVVINMFYGILTSSTRNDVITYALVEEPNPVQAYKMEHIYKLAEEHAYHYDTDVFYVPQHKVDIVCKSLMLSGFTYNIEKYDVLKVKGPKNIILTKNKK